MFMLVSLGVLIGVVIFLRFFLYWLDDSPDAAKIKFKAFERFYSINPDRWELEDGCVICRIYNDKKKPYDGLFYNYTKDWFRFGFIDYYRYKKFKRKIERNKVKEKNIQIASRMLKAVREDIENMESLAQKQQSEAMDNIRSILNNLGGTK